MGEISWTESKATTNGVWQHFKTGVVRSDVNKKKIKKNKNLIARQRQDLYRK